MRRRALAALSLAIGCLGVVVAASPASAALCARWDAPAQVAVGSTASISFRTFVPFAEDGGTYNLEPHAFPDYPFKIHAISPHGERSRIEMAPSAGDDQRWSGQLTPDEGGPWTLTIANLQSADAVCYTDAILVAEGNARSRTPTFTVLGILVFLGGVAGFSLLRRRRSRRTAISPGPP